MTMKWTKLGQIFDPTDFTLPDNCTDYAEGPQAVPLGHRVRVWTSRHVNATPPGSS